MNKKLLHTILEKKIFAQLPAFPIELKRVMGIIGEILVKSRCVNLFYIGMYILCILYAPKKKDQNSSNHFGFCGLIIFAKFIYVGKVVLHIFGSR